MLHPALNSFLHAIEWTLIAGLKVKGKDVIEEEGKSGRDYYLNELIKEARAQNIISDKVRDRLIVFNKSHRRWTAHHKTGEVVEEDIKHSSDLFKMLANEIQNSK